MEPLLPAAHHDGLYAAFRPKPFGLGGGCFSSPDLLTCGADPFCRGYAAHPFGRGRVRSVSPSSSLSFSDSDSVFDTDSDNDTDTSSGSVFDEGDDWASAVEHRAHLARLALQYQQPIKRYQLCFSHLADTSDEVVALRRENEKLRFVNAELVRRISRLTEEHAKAKAMPPQPPPAAVVLPVPLTTPKSISVRSTGYIKMNPSGKHRVSNRKNTGAQRVLVGVNGGAAKGEKEGAKDQGAGVLEIEAYNQGMFKTELCNKWEETGACPYGDRCQFAHGIAELRPVIRHPRYKTQLCRMVLAGTLCPYGHRCHFRHSITPANGHLLRP